MQHERKARPDDLPDDVPIEWLPTEPQVEEASWKDSSLDLASGLDVTELPIEQMDSRLGVSAASAMRPVSDDEQRARALGVQARRSGGLPDASPFEPGSALDLVWLDGYRSAS